MSGFLSQKKKKAVLLNDSAVAAEIASRAFLVMSVAQQILECSVGVKNTSDQIMKE